MLVHCSVKNTLLLSCDDDFKNALEALVPPLSTTFATPMELSTIIQPSSPEKFRGARVLDDEDSPAEAARAFAAHAAVAEDAGVGTWSFGASTSSTVLKRDCGDTVGLMVNTKTPLLSPRSRFNARGLA